MLQFLVIKKCLNPKKAAINIRLLHIKGCHLEKKIQKPAKIDRGSLY
jgi:hypothetical protein